MSNGSYKYIGMTTQNLQKRFAQHKADARSGSCSLSNKLCQKRQQFWGGRRCAAPDAGIIYSMGLSLSDVFLISVTVCAPPVPGSVHWGLNKKGLSLSRL